MNVLPRGLTSKGNPDNLTWALFEFPTAVHAVPGKFTAGERPTMGSHVATSECPCHPDVLWDTDAAPLPLYEHRIVQ